jgi:predicted membrane-bound spermidine synthase
MLKKILFYLSSFIIEREVFCTSSPYNAELKVVLNNGTYLLNSGKANYSFGNLHRVFQKVFARTKLAEKNIKSALLLGFGTGSVAHILQHELKINCHITGVEIDSVVIKLARNYFKLTSLNDCEILSRMQKFFFKLLKKSTT